MGQASIERTSGVRRPAALRLLPDDRLARRAAEGDRGAFAVIFERHHQGLYRYCRAIVRHDEDARDALQTTFARAIAALDGEQRSLAIKPWLYRIAHNEAISLLRRRRPQDALDAQAEAASASPGPAYRLIVSERMRQLLADLEQLPDRQRWALLLRELNELTYTEMAAALETSEQAARQSVYEARVMLMELQEGREMPCEDVRRLISERDGRLLRPRRVRAHMHSCEGCTGFREAISRRRSDLGVIAPPLPAAAAAALLNALLGASGGGGGWGGGGLVAALSAGKGLVAGAGSKTMATAAAIAIAGSAFVVTEPDVPPPYAGTGPAAAQPRLGAASIGPVGPRAAVPRMSPISDLTRHGGGPAFAQVPAAGTPGAPSGQPAPEPPEAPAPDAAGAPLPVAATQDGRPTQPREDRESRRKQGNGDGDEPARAARDDQGPADDATDAGKARGDNGAGKDEGDAGPPADDVHGDRPSASGQQAADRARGGGGDSAIQARVARSHPSDERPVSGPLKPQDAGATVEGEGPSPDASEAPRVVTQGAPAGSQETS